MRFKSLVSPVTLIGGVHGGEVEDGDHVACCFYG